MSAERLITSQVVGYQAADCPDVWQVAVLRSSGKFRQAAASIIAHGCHGYVAGAGECRGRAGAMNDFNLERFLDAQRDDFDAALSEIAVGKKRTHWMWFIFPQLAGLGRSPRALYYGLTSLDEASAYLAEKTLGKRLRQCVRTLLQHESKLASEIFGFPDDAKLRSCLTLFEAAAADDEDRRLFNAALLRFFAGRRDPKTLSMIGLEGLADLTVDPAIVERLGAVANPFSQQIIAMIRSSAVRALRRIVCERTGVVWCWSAELASHADGARILGATYTQPAGGDILTFDD